MIYKVGLPESAALLHAFHVRPESVVATNSACFTCGSVYRSAVFVSSSLATTVLPEVVSVGTTRAFVIAVLHYRKHQGSEESRPLPPVSSFLPRPSRVTPLPPPGWAPPAVFNAPAPSLRTAYPATCGSFTAGAAATSRLTPPVPPFPPPSNAAAHTPAQLPGPRPTTSLTGTRAPAAPAAASRRRASDNRCLPRPRSVPRQ